MSTKVGLCADKIVTERVTKMGGECFSKKYFVEKELIFFNKNVLSLLEKYKNEN